MTCEEQKAPKMRGAPSRLRDPLRPANGQLFQVTFQHPQRFGVDSEAFNGEIFGFGVICFTCGAAESIETLNQCFMRDSETCDEILSRATRRQFPDGRKVSKGGQSAWRVGIERAKVLGDFVDSGEKFLILPLESGVKVEEVRPLDIPVRQMGLAHELVAVGEEVNQTFNDRRSGFSGIRCLCDIHIDIDSII